MYITTSRTAPLVIENADGPAGDAWFDNLDIKWIEGVPQEDDPPVATISPHFAQHVLMIAAVSSSNGGIDAHVYAQPVSSEQMIEYKFEAMMLPDQGRGQIKRRR